MGAAVQAMAGAASDRRNVELADQLRPLERGIALREVQLAQIATNTKEAESTNWFVAGWRPFVGWVCGVALLLLTVRGSDGRPATSTLGRAAR